MKQKIQKIIYIEPTEEKKGPLILQYVFFMDNEESLMSCDDAGHEFLSMIDIGFFYAQLQAIKINTAITNTTIILGGKSYNLRMVPTNLQIQAENLDTNVNSMAYIIVLHDQTLFSYFFQKLNQAKLDDYRTLDENQLSRSQLNKTFDASEGGIFITNSNGTVIFVNKAYEKATGLHINDIIGKNISDLGASGFFTPIIAPDIIETKQSLTTLQKLATGKYAAASASPIYDS